jgi:hypothetical protein
LKNREEKELGEEKIPTYYTPTKAWALGCGAKILLVLVFCRNIFLHIQTIIHPPHNFSKIIFYFLPLNFRLLAIFVYAKHVDWDQVLRDCINLQL